LTALYLNMSKFPTDCCHPGIYWAEVPGEYDRTPEHAGRNPGVAASGNSVKLLTFEFPPCNGGISRLCGEISNGLRARGVKVDLVTDQRFGPTPLSLDSVVSVTSRRGRREFSAWRHLRQHRNHSAALCGLWYPEGLIASLAGLRPRVLLAHGAELMPVPSRLREPIWKRLRRWTCEEADLVIANSEYTRKLVLKAAPQTNAIALPLGVNHRQFSPGHKEAAKREFGVTDYTVISSVSRLQDFKGHRTVLRALSCLPEASRNRIRYLLAGKGPDEENLRRLTLELGIGEQVRFTGFVDEQALPNIYRASDLFVLCTQEIGESRSVEGFGLVFLEAQACGTPVVGTKTGGIPDAIREGCGGWMIAQDDTAALARILQHLLDEPEYFRKMGRMARDRVEQECTWDKYIDDFIEAMVHAGVMSARPRTA
jgi:phosphatidylinositol alpha-1,6-mannosyltransferase